MTRFGLNWINKRRLVSLHRKWMVNITEFSTKATNQSGTVSETIYDAAGKVLSMTPSGGYPAGVARAEWSVTDKKGTRFIIQKIS